MAWARLDDNFHDHPKVLGLSIDAVGLYTLALTWAHRNTRNTSMPGLIPSSLPTRFAGAKAKKLAADLVGAGMWEEVPNGWHIHDFDDYLPDDKTRAERSKAGRKGAAKRWRQNSKLPSGCHDGAMGLPEDSMANDGSRADARWEVLRTSPVPVPVPDGTYVPPIPAEQSAGSEAGSALLSSLRSSNPAINRKGATTNEHQPTRSASATTRGALRSA